MALPSTVDSVVVGAGHAGLTMSWFLRQAGSEHLVLERRTTRGGGWQDRWDGFRLVTPNWSASFPGHSYDGPDPGGFMPRDEIVRRVARYADQIAAPIALDTVVRRLTARHGGGFRLETSQGVIDAREVVVATGNFHVPRVPTIGASTPLPMTACHSPSTRRNSPRSISATPACLPSSGRPATVSTTSGSTCRSGTSRDSRGSDAASVTCPASTSSAFYGSTPRVRRHCPAPSLTGATWRSEWDYQTTWSRGPKRTVRAPLRRWGTRYRSSDPGSSRPGSWRGTAGGSPLRSRTRARRRSRS